MDNEKTETKQAHSNIPENGVTKEKVIEKNDDLNDTPYCPCDICSMHDDL